MKLLILPGDGIGPEVTAEAIKVCDCLRREYGWAVEWEEALVGGVAIDATGEPLPAATLELAQAADAVLLGAVGGPKYDQLPTAQRPERGLLGLRRGLDLFANLRPAQLLDDLLAASTLKPEVVRGLDLLIVRELTGGIYFGQPRGTQFLETGERVAFNTEVYSEQEVERIARVAFELAGQRQRRLCSVDKANVLESSQFWREIVQRLAADYPDVELSHLYVDNAAMQLVRAPKQFDVMVTSNMFGDILSDCAAMLTGSIGMLPSASLNAAHKGMYEPVHGSAPDIAGQGIANPLATILSIAMLLRYTSKRPDLADKIATAVQQVLHKGLRTRDIAAAGEIVVGTQAMGDAVVTELQQLAT